MKKRAILRGLLGFPQGVAIGYAISIIISLCIGGGAYYPCSPSLVAAVGSEIGAVMVQFVLCGLMGSLFAGSSIIWEIEDWSIARQTGTYFILTALFVILISWPAGWMVRSWSGFILYFGTFICIFVIIFVLIWAIRCRMWRGRVRKINERLKEGEKKGR